MPSNPTDEETQSHGRYYAEYVQVTSNEPEQQSQELLDSKDNREWNLVGVAGGLPEGGLLLFWDTQRPSFGRSSSR